MLSITFYESPWTILSQWFLSLSFFWLLLSLMYGCREILKTDGGIYRLDHEIAEKPRGNLQKSVQTREVTIIISLLSEDISFC